MHAYSMLAQEAADWSQLASSSFIPFVLLMSMRLSQLVGNAGSMLWRAYGQEGLCVARMHGRSWTW